MSNFTKGQGAKIGILFTEDLVGDVSGSEDAFAITGKEYKYVNGVLIDKTYIVDKVERYPVQRIWELEEKNTSLDINDYQEGDVDTADSSTLSGSSYTTVANEVEFKKNTTIVKIKVKTVTAGDYTLMIKDLANTVTYQTKTLTGQPANSFVDFEINPLEVSIGNQYRIEVTRPSGKGYMVSGLYDGTNWKCLRGLFGTSWFTNYTNAMGFVEQGISEYETPKTITTESLQITGEYRVRWSDNKPINTDITIEYTTGETQNEWQEILKGDVVIADTNLWLRFTLETTDTSVTPILENLWLEEADEPQDKILITMDWWGKFNNIEGDLTVSYDATKGNLTGAGGAVESFSKTFTPQDLIPEPNPHVEEYITVAPIVELDYIPIDYINGFATEQITVAPSIEIVFEEVEIINP